MIKAKGQMADANGVSKEVLILGLSFGNLRRLHSQPLETFIRIEGSEINIPFDIVICSGKTEADLYKALKPALTTDAKIHTTPSSPAADTQIK